ncbi:murein hydrolase activator EnvC family protein [Bacteroidota bacterium]
MVDQIKIIIVLVFISNLLALSQSQDEISKKNIELQNIRDEIMNLGTKLTEFKQKEEESLQLLELLKKQSLLLNKMINNLKIEEEKKEIEIISIEKKIRRVSVNVVDLKTEYANYVRWLYKYKNHSRWKWILNSDSPNQAVIRYKYLEYITDNNEEKLNSLKDYLKELNTLNEKLEEERRNRNNLITEKSNEQNALRISKQEKEKLIITLKQDQKNIETEIESKRLAEIKIRELIVKLEREAIERERIIRENKLKGIESENTRKFIYNNFNDFAELKGKLNWPVISGEIVRDFGENLNEKLKTVTLNYGIDIQSKPDSEVYAVADGIVSIIDWIPGYGSVLILTHKNQFRTVYGHLKDIKVNEGDILSSGTPLGLVNESLEGDILHFEVWDERNYQDPNIWLVKAN